jgi:fermentation-respiration switch protein FrsA (DUF1100 family)
MMVERRDVEFAVEGGDHLRGWLFLPEAGRAQHPVISMEYGYAGVKEHGLERFAQSFAQAGFVVLVHDHRNFGASDGAVRGAWTNDVTVRSGRLARMYEPGAWIARVSPTLLLMIVALADHITLTALELRAYEQAVEPKRLVTIEGGHFDPYPRQFAVASAAVVSCSTSI